MQALLALLLSSAPLVPGSYPGGSEVVGEIGRHTAVGDESMMEIARQYGLGHEQMVAANPGVDAFLPGDGVRVTVPTALVVPRAVRPGHLVVNLSEMRLYYLVPGDRASGERLLTFPVGIGSEGFATPLGSYAVVQKVVHPAWYVPPSVLRENPRHPRVVPPGPDNPLGSHALRLSRMSILIHGTNKPWGVGKKASRGCIRLYPEDIPRLFEVVSTGTPVVVVRETVKLGVRGERVYLEAHRDDAAGADAAHEAFRLIDERGLAGRISAKKILAAVREKLGFPVDVTR